MQIKLLGTSRKKYHFKYHFSPVGQGLFSYGAIFKCGVTNPLFLWVYDCGTSSPQHLIDSSIEHLEERVAGPEKQIDLLTLSHFDWDHISGVCKLIGRFRIGTLMLPYMPLSQRLRGAFGKRSQLSDDLIRFFVNPGEYFTGLEGAQIERILFVPPSGGGALLAGSVELALAPENLLEEGDRWSIDIEIDKDWINMDEDKMLLQEAIQKNNPSTEVAFLKRATAIRLLGVWEFVPYNDDPEHPIPQEFCAVVTTYRDSLLARVTADSRKIALSELRAIYDKVFGRNSQRRNAISLFQYSGPIYSSWFGLRLLRVPPDIVTTVAIAREEINLNDEWFPISCDFLEDGSLLNTGDGYLDKKQHLDRLINYLGDERIRRVAVLQVMHHGAKRNWHRGVARAIAPAFSVFCSDPENGYRHPNSDVLKDFLQYGAEQVDKTNFFEATGILFPR